MSEAITTIARHTAAACGTSLTDLMSDRRDERTIEARHLAMWLAHKLTPLPLAQIGSAFRRDESTVCHALKRVNRRRECDGMWREKVNRLLDRLEPVQTGQTPPPPLPATPVRVGEPALQAHDLMEVNWGFMSHGFGRNYFVEQNEAFVRAMRAAGHREGPPPE